MDIVDEFLLDSLQIERVAENDKDELLALLALLLLAIIREFQKHDPTSVTRKMARELRLDDFRRASLKEIKTTYRQALTLLKRSSRAVSDEEAKRIGEILKEASGGKPVRSVVSNNTQERINAGVFVDGAPLKEWIEKQAGDLQFRIQTEVLRGLLAGLTAAQIIEKLKGTKGANFKDGVTYQAGRHLAALAKTQLAATLGTVRDDIANQNEDIIQFKQHISVLDSRTSQTCLAYAWKVWTLDNKPVGHDLPFNNGTPRHFNCRSITVPVLIGQKPMGEMNFESWINSKSDEFQNKLFGKSKAELWRNGKISQSDLVDQSGRPITLEDLLRKLRSR